jgi:Transposase IS66 family
MGRRNRRSRRQTNQGKPSPESSAQGARIEALLDQVQKIDLAAIQDARERAMISLLLNLVEDLRGELRKAQQEIAYLRERLRLGPGGEDQSGDRPASAPPQTTHSSEKERKEPQERTKRAKLSEITINREEKLELERANLPEDAEDKGYEAVVVQELRIATENVRFLRKKYYSASRGKTYLAPLPDGYQGEFGPNVRTLCVMFSHLCHMTEPKIGEWFANMGILISAGQISHFLTQGHEAFHREKEEIVEAGLHSSPWQHIDDTGTRVDGVNWHCQVICNPLYTAYFTTERKDRLTVIDVLRNRRPRVFRLNDEALALLRQFGVSARTREQLRPLPWEQELSETELEDWLNQLLPQLGATARSRIVEASAIAAYHAEVGHPVVQLLICDDAKQFKLVTRELGLCWIHDGRHYKHLEPCVAYHRQLLDGFLQRYWDYYKELLAYRQQPSAAEAMRLSGAFDELFSTTTGYAALDQRIAKTQANKGHLLMVLRHPEIPLHNNSAELEARGRVRKRVVSYGPRSPQGAQAWDTFQTLLGTAKKLGVNFFHYLRDRISGARQMPSLADLIHQRAKDLQLGASWAPS